MCIANLCPKSLICSLNFFDSILTTTPSFPIFFFNAVCTYEKFMYLLLSKKLHLLIVIFSPILEISLITLSSTLFPSFIIFFFKLLKSPFSSKHNLERFSEKFKNSKFFAAKSVSQLISTIEDLLFSS